MRAKHNCECLCERCLGACPGCGKVVEGSHFCPGPDPTSKMWTYSKAKHPRDDAYRER